MYMLQKQSEAPISDVDDSSSSRSDDDNFPDDDFHDDIQGDEMPPLPVSSVDSLFSDYDGTNDNRSSGALIAGKKPKPERISLRSTSDRDDIRLDSEYGLMPTRLSRGSSGGFRFPIAKIKTLFDASSASDVRYNPLLGPPSFQRNSSSSSQTGALVDLELAPMQRKHAADIPNADWDLSKTAWGAHIRQGAFDASSRPKGDWEAPSNAATYEPSSQWGPSFWLRTSKYTSRQSCLWMWQISIAMAVAVVLLVLLYYRSRW